MPLMFRAVNDTQLSGAFIVDPAGAAAPDDRVFVITDWTSLTLAQLREIAAATDIGVAFNAIAPKFTFLMNGLGWPHTERLTARLNQPERWRVINLSTQTHTMHLHGFYFDVESLGDGFKDKRHAPGVQPKVVTQLMPAGATMAMTWTPERAGNWLFHCHIRAHVSPEVRLGRLVRRSRGHTATARTTPRQEWPGMILGVTVLGGDEAARTAAEHPAGESTPPFAG